MQSILVNYKNPEDINIKMAKKSGVKKELHRKKLSVSIEDNEFEKELKSIKKHMRAKFELHPFAFSMLFIVLILFVTAAFLAYQSLNATVENVISNDISDEAEDDIFIPIDSNGNKEIRPEAEVNDKLEESSCVEVEFVPGCDGSYPGYECDLISDNDLTTQWIAASSCTSGRNPCPVNNYVTFNSSEEFRYVKIWNRVEEGLYINRLFLNYNDVDSHSEILGYDYRIEPYMIKLLEPTKDLELHIVEIRGVGKYYQTGLAEVKLFSGVCE